MYKEEIKTNLNVETFINGKPTNDVIEEICDICHSGLMDSTYENMEIDELIDDLKYEECIDKLMNKKELLESVLCRILNLLGD